MSKIKIKKDDNVIVISGEDRGTTGRVLKVIRDKNRAIVEGVNIVTKATKPSAKHPQGGLIKMEAPSTSPIWHSSTPRQVSNPRRPPSRRQRQVSTLRQEIRRGDQIMETTLSKEYKERIVPALTKEFNYTTVMQVPRLVKIVINQGLGQATQDKKIIETAINELTAITGQKAVATLSRKDISNFKVRKKMPIGVRVTLRRERMYEFLERLVRVALPRIRDFKGIDGKLDGRGNYTLGITEQIIFPEINIDSISKLLA